LARLEAFAIPDLPEVAPGDDLAALLGAAGARLDPPLGPGDVLAVAHKVVSKAEGRLRALAAVDPGERARALAAEHDKDPRHVQAILDETVELLRADRGRLICRTRHGFTCANAGVDRSNAGAPDMLVLLPEAPDRSAAALRERLGAGAVIVTDSWGRPWRQGQIEVAIGSAGLRVLVDHRGRPDRDGRPMAASVTALADEVAAAADLARTKTSGEPAVRVRGLQNTIIEAEGPGAAALIRPPEDDLFR
jgi:coenzyme F420-0:L-glutamate ligase/coenzyme F420-1:gamma-L-glutamate ligase